MHKLVLLRHGESQWNLENRFTGWTDVDLSEKGCCEAVNAGRLLKQESIVPDVAYTSLLKRAIRTLWIVLEQMDMMWIPVFKSWHLNERHYGALQGLNKPETAKKYGAEQVHIWRRSYDTCPPALQLDDERYPGHDLRYRNLSANELPVTECLADTVERLLPYWEQVLVPELRQGKTMLVAAHGNSLRALVMYLDGLSKEEIVEVNIPTGVPLVYELDNELHVVSHRYLGDDAAVQAAVTAVAGQAEIHKQAEE